MIANMVCFSSMRIKVPAGLYLCKLVGCAVRTGIDHQTEDARCAQRTLRFLGLNRSCCCAFRSRAALTNSSPPAPVGLVRDAGYKGGPR